MTSQIVIINGNRSFAITESNLTLDEFKTYSGEEKMFKVSDNLSAIVLISGNGRFDSRNLKSYISKYLAKTDMDEIKSVLEIKDSLNDCIVKSSRKSNPTEYVQYSFPKFESKIRYLSKIMDSNLLLKHLKLNSFDGEIDVLKDNELLNDSIIGLAHSIFNDVNLAGYIKRGYYNYIVKSSTNLAIVGYDEENENPSYVKYAILFNDGGNLVISEEYCLNDCKSTMVFTIAQDEDINLNLTGFNDESYRQIKKIVFELFDEFFESHDKKILNSINEKLEDKIFELKLENLGQIVEYIEFLPDDEILRLLDILIELTSIKKKFSNEPHSVGGRRVKTILRKYDGVRFVR